jgi:hypothetical protein
VAYQVSGVPAFVRRRRTPLAQGLGLEPDRVWHALGHEWIVMVVLNIEEHAGPQLGCRWRARVHGPLPGRPGRCGEFEMFIWAYGDGPGWRIAPAQDTQLS